jgi:hypothetical protein
MVVALYVPSSLSTFSVLSPQSHFLTHIYRHRCDLFLKIKVWGFLVLQKIYKIIILLLTYLCSYVSHICVCMCVCVYVY